MTRYSALVPALVFLAPLFLIFELVQLVVAERYLGVKQIARGDDPRTRSPSEVVAFFWSFGIVAYWLWMLSLLCYDFTRLYAGALLGLTFVGNVLRFNVGLRLILVILTLEGALRIPVLATLMGITWKRL
jgi:hypothetical protein